MKYLLPLFYLLLAMILTSAGLLKPVAVIAQENEPILEDFLQQVEKNSLSISSFACDFTQVRHLTIFPEPVIFSGRLSLSRPDKLRWEFIKPLASVLVLNGNKGLKCSDGGPVRDFSLDVDPVMRLVARQLWAWTSGSYRELMADFEFKIMTGPVLILSPRPGKGENFISKIKVVFEPDFLQPLEVAIYEPGGDRTLISFAGYQRNVGFRDNLFTECRSR